MNKQSQIDKSKKRRLIHEFQKHGNLSLGYVCSYSYTKCRHDFEALIDEGYKYVRTFAVD